MSGYWLFLCYAIFIPDLVLLSILLLPLPRFIRVYTLRLVNRVSLMVQLMFADVPIDRALFIGTLYTDIRWRPTCQRPFGLCRSYIRRIRFYVDFS